jgi:hypothetical protein
VSDWTAYGGSVRDFNPPSTNWGSAAAPGSEEERKILFRKVRTKLEQAGKHKTAYQVVKLHRTE